MTELVPLNDPNDIVNLPAEQRGQLITRALVESKQWLAVATKGTDPTPIAEFKVWAATLAEVARQKGLAEDIQLDAMEMVRRAERALGLTIRNGQEAGVVRSTGQHGVEADGNSISFSPKDFVSSKDELVRGPYPLTDGVSDQQFEEVIEEARAEKNMGRANVARKARERRSNPPPAEPEESWRNRPLAERIAQVRRLAESNHSSRQIAEAIGVSRVDNFRKFAVRHGIAVPADAVMSDRSRRIDPARVVAQTVSALEGLAMGLQLLDDGDYLALDPELVKEWNSSLTTSLAAITRMRKEMNRVGK
jgi:hypothetical protein